MEKLMLSAPWVTYIHELQLLFEQDTDIRMVVDSNLLEVKLYVEDWRKADALSKLLPQEKVFGNVTLKIEVIPANHGDGSAFYLIQDAFKGNPVFVGAESASKTIGTFNYAVFKKEVAQFFNDQLDDINGYKSMLYQDIAKDVLGEKDGVFYCTHWCEINE